MGGKAPKPSVSSVSSVPVVPEAAKPIQNRLNQIAQGILQPVQRVAPTGNITSPGNIGTGEISQIFSPPSNSSISPNTQALQTELDQIKANPSMVVGPGEGGERGSNIVDPNQTARIAELEKQIAAAKNVSSTSGAVTPQQIPSGVVTGGKIPQPQTNVSGIVSGEDTLGLPFNILPTSVQEGLGLDAQDPNAFVVPESGLESLIRNLNISDLIGNRPGEQLSKQKLTETVAGVPTPGLTDPQLAARGQLSKNVAGDFLSPDSNPFLKQYVDSLRATSNKNLGENLAKLKDTAFTAGAGDSSRLSLMEGEATADSQRNLDQIIAQSYMDNLARERAIQQQSTGELIAEEQIPKDAAEKERQRQLAAVEPLVNIEALPSQRLTQAEGLAAVPRTMEQQEKAAEIQDFLRQQEERLTPIQLAQSIFGQQLGQSTPVVTPSASANVGSLLGGVGGLVGGAASAVPVLSKVLPVALGGGSL